LVPVSDIAMLLFEPLLHGPGTGIAIKKLLVLVIVIAVLIFGAGWYVTSRGFSARTPPGKAETFAARQLRRMAISKRAAALKNPVPPSPEALSEAMEHFADHCATCHGNDGSGRSHIGSGLYPPAPDMTLAETQKLSDGELYYIIENGIRFTGMPAFGAMPDNDEDADSWKLVHFIRHLPIMTDDEIALMTTMNPKSPMDLERERRIQEFLQGGQSPPEDHTHHH
jgi:mono/diheme cytochrome c family protein